MNRVVVVAAVLLSLALASPAVANCAYSLTFFLTLPGGGPGKESVGTYRTLRGMPDRP